VKDTRLFDADKQHVDVHSQRPNWNTPAVMYSNCVPATTSEFMPVELCLISRSDYAPFHPTSVETWPRYINLDVEEHNINLLVIETKTGVSKRVAVVSIRDAALWKRAKKEWRLIKLM
jgi:hypothetical protein